MVFTKIFVDSELSWIIITLTRKILEMQTAEENKAIIRKDAGKLADFIMFTQRSFLLNLSKRLQSNGRINPLAANAASPDRAERPVQAPALA